MDKISLLRYGIRTVLVALVLAITFLVPHFEDMIGLVGGFVNSFMGFIIPPLLYLKLFKEQLSTMAKWGHVMIMVFGLFCLIASTTYTIESIRDG